MTRNNIAPTTDINVPAIVTSAGDVLSAKGDRGAWSVQNTGTNALFVRLGTAASTTVHHFILKAGTGNDDGTGGSVGEGGEGAVYSGIISVAGTSPRFIVRES